MLVMSEIILSVTYLEPMALMGYITKKNVGRVIDLWYMLIRDWAGHDVWTETELF